MKKVSLIFTAAAMAFLASCGPSAEEKAAEQKRIDDSIAAADAARVQDSLAQVEKMKQDSIASAQKAMEDSLKMKAMQDSLAAAQDKLKKASAPKPKPKATTPPKQDEKPKEAKPAMGRG